MDIHQIVQQAITDSWVSCWPAFAPEIIICMTIFVLLLARLFAVGRLVPPFLIALAGTVVALYYACPYLRSTDAVELSRHELFSGMLVYDPFSVFIRTILVVFALLLIVLTRLTNMPHREEGTDFYSLILGATLGMCLMASANHLLIVFLGVEMASVPSYVLAAMQKGRRDSSEAGLKYSVYGAGAAGIMLYGISLLGGLVHSFHLPTIARELAARLATSGSQGGLGSEETMVLVLAGLMIAAGMAFKLSAFPFHFWCPDVFEGATAEVNAFLSVASKGAALALLIRLVLGVGLLSPAATLPPTVNAPAVGDENQEDLAMRAVPVLAQFTVGDDATLGLQGASTATSANDAASVDGANATVAAASPTSGVGGAWGATKDLAKVRHFLALLIAGMAIVTCTFGNLAAYAQTNIKRLMAYSTIAHAGYMLLPIPAALALADVDAGAAQQAVASLGIYLAIYLFMNLGAFAIVALLRNHMGSEEISDYAGLIHSAPGVVICLSLILFSLVGLPPLAGFVGKFMIFASLMDAYRLTNQTFLLILLIIGGLNTAVSLFYYLRVVKVMTIDAEPETAVRSPLSLLSLVGAYTTVVTIPVVLLFLSWDMLNGWTSTATRHLF